MRLRRDFWNSLEADAATPVGAIVSADLPFIDADWIDMVFGSFTAAQLLKTMGDHRWTSKCDAGSGWGCRGLTELQVCVPCGFESPLPTAGEPGFIL